MTQPTQEPEDQLKAELPINNDNTNDNSIIIVILIMIII